MMHRLNDVELSYLPIERESMIPDDYSFFLSRNETILENATNSKTFVPTQYKWVHLSCATWIPGPIVTPKTAVRLNKMDEKRFTLQCIICFKKDGACMQCQSSRCQIAFHIECARRAGYCMEIDKRPDVKENLLNMTPVQKTDARATFEKTYRVFCEKHRPLKIVKELEQRDQQTMDEIQRFCKIVDKCMEIDYRHQLRPSSHRLEKRREKERREKERERESLRNQEISTKHQNKQNVSLERERAREQKMFHKKLLQQAKPLKQT